MQALRLSAGSKRPAFLSPLIWAHLLANEDNTGAEPTSSLVIAPGGEPQHRSAPVSRSETDMVVKSHNRRCSVASSIAVRRDLTDTLVPPRLRSKTLPSGSRPEIIDVIASGAFAPRIEDKPDVLGAFRARLSSSSSLEAERVAKGGAPRTRGSSIEPTAISRVQSPLRTPLRISDEPDGEREEQGRDGVGQSAPVLKALMTTNRLVKDDLQRSGSLDSRIERGIRAGAGALTRRPSGWSPTKFGTASTLNAPPHLLYDLASANQEVLRLRQLLADDYRAWSSPPRPVVASSPSPPARSPLSIPQSAQAAAPKPNVEILLTQILRRMDILEAEMVRLNRQVTEMKRNVNSSLVSDEPSEVAPAATTAPAPLERPATATQASTQQPVREALKPPRPMTAPPSHLLQRTTSTARAPRAFLTMPVDDDLADSTLNEIRRRLGVVTETMALEAAASAPELASPVAEAEEPRNLQVAQSREDLAPSPSGSARNNRLIPRKPPVPFEMEEIETGGEHPESHTARAPSVQTVRSSKKANLVARITSGSFGKGTSTSGGRGRHGRSKLGSVSASDLKGHGSSKSVSLSDVVELQSLGQIQRDMARGPGGGLPPGAPPVPVLPPLSYRGTPLPEEETDKSVFHPLARIRPHTFYSDEKRPESSPAATTRRPNEADLATPIKRGRRRSNLFQALGFSPKPHKQLRPEVERM